MNIKRKESNYLCYDVEKEMVVRYMMVLTQIFVKMEYILSVYNFSDKDGPKIQSWMSNKPPRNLRLCTLKKAVSQNELLINDITDVDSKNKRKYNTTEEDKVKPKNMKSKILNLLVD